MGAIIINGKEIASKIRQELKVKLNKIYNEKGVKLGLATVIVGGDPASMAYVKNKERVCSEVGLNSFTYELPYETSQEEVVRLINDLNFREDIHGILIQVPLPKHIDEKGVKLGLATVIVGGDPASMSYVKNKEKVCNEVGLNSFTYE
ncbi:MAG TPA: hypothetical protein DEF85_07475, partial [Clostridiaceae bacterium]|nr:hypothetical protein [Clostridiaceae bacterium]